MRKDSVNRINWLEVVGILVVSAVIWFVAEYFVLVPLNFRAVGLWLTIVINALAILGISSFCWAEEEYDNEDGHWTFSLVFKRVSLVISCICILALIIGGFSGSHLFNAKSYSELIEVEEANFTEDFNNINPDQLIIVDMKTAQKLGDRQLANFQNPSYFDVDDEYNLVRVGDDYVRITPLNYGGLFKAGKAGSIPGYITVDAKTQAAKAVKLETPMVYSPSAYWSKDLSRHLHMLYPSYILSKSYFEVDDEGTPFWITAVKTPTIGLFGGKLEKSVLITNCITGETTEYSVDAVPNWVDHIHSVSYVMSLLENHYTLANGFWNSIFGKTGVFNTAYQYRESRSDKEESQYTPFEGYNSLVDKDGNVMFYTGITPSNNAETNYGFVLVSPRNDGAKFYSVTGAEESSAQKAAEGLVSDLKYSASFPTIVNIDGEETYFMLLKDGAGLVQKYAFCNIENYSKVVEANTLDAAIKKYQARINNLSYTESENATTTEEDVPRETETITGQVITVEQAELGGYTYYYFTIEGDDFVYMSSIQNSNLQPMKLKNGTTVTITYYDSTEAGLRIVTELKF